MKKTLYIDCDGVIIPSNEYTTELIDICVENFNCIWISDREIEITDGELDYIEDFKMFLSAGDIEKLYQIDPNPKKNRLKSERLDLNLDFYWLDDAPVHEDLVFLEKNQLLNRLIILKSWRPETTKKAIEKLKNLI